MVIKVDEGNLKQGLLGLVVALVERARARATTTLKVSAERSVK
jgi:hypothetical protein